jgi:preprotein translocase subunit SecA
MNQQREAVYSERQRILKDEDIIAHTWEIIEGVALDIFDQYYPENGEADPERASARLKSIFGAGLAESLQGVDHTSDLEPVKEHILKELKNRFDSRVADMDSETRLELFRFIVLHTLDQNWKDHLLAQDELRKGIGLRAIGQKDPLLEYQFESYNLFQEMMQRVRETVAELAMRVSIVSEKPGTRAVPRDRKMVESRDLDLSSFGKHSGTDLPERPGKQKPVRTVKVGRNDPCPCGSGKKYKHCCGKNV